MKNEHSSSSSCSHLDYMSVVPLDGIRWHRCMKCVCHFFSTCIILGRRFNHCNKVSSCACCACPLCRHTDNSICQGVAKRGESKATVETRDGIGQKHTTMYPGLGPSCGGNTSTYCLFDHSSVYGGLHSCSLSCASMN